jgi:hypothetical protein
LEEIPERGSKPVTGRDPRPKAPGHVWAWIVIAVCTVIFFSITLWVVVGGPSEVTTLSGHDRVHQLARPWVERWAQVPGPPSTYNAAATAAVGRGDFADAFRLTSMSLALDADQVDVWARMVCLSAVDSSNPYAIGRAERDPLLGLLGGAGGGEHVLAVATEWSSMEATLGASLGAVDQFVGRCFSVPVSRPGSKTVDTLDVSP